MNDEIGSLRLIYKKDREFTIEWTEPNILPSLNKPSEYHIYRGVLTTAGLYSFAYVSRDENLSDTTKIKWAKLLSDLPIIGYNSNDVFIPDRKHQSSPISDASIPEGKREVGH